MNLSRENFNKGRISKDWETGKDIEIWYDGIGVEGAILIADGHTTHIKSASIIERLSKALGVQQ